MKVQAENMAATTEVSAEQERRIIQPILDRLVNALNNGDATLWSSAWHLEDDLAREAQKTWFEGYVLKVRPRLGRQLEQLVRTEQVKFPRNPKQQNILVAHPKLSDFFHAEPV